jgi:hypothetical protein
VPTLQEIEEDLTLLSERQPELAMAFARLTSALAAAGEIREADKPPVAFVLCEIVQALVKEPAARRSREAMDHLTYGFRQMIAQVPALSRLWAEIEPKLTRVARSN